MSLLEVSNLHVSYGAIQALRGCSLHVDEGEIVTLIGGNGAGKSTMLRTISGLLTPVRVKSALTAMNSAGARLMWSPARV